MQNVETTKNEHEPVLQFIYKNWKGNTAIRNVVNPQIIWGTSAWYNDGQPTWLIEAFDMEKQAMRSFAIDNIIGFESLPF